MNLIQSHHLEKLIHPQFKGALFDFDGTLALTAKLWHEIDRTFFAHHKLPYSDEASAELESKSFSDGANWVINTYGLALTADEIMAEWQELSSELYAKLAQPRPGALAYLDYLISLGIPCALATINEPTLIAASDPQYTLRQRFDALLFGTDVSHGKDNPEIYLKATEKIGVAPQDCMVFEDIEVAITSAQSVGMHTTLVYSQNPLQQFETLAKRCDAALVSWDELNLA